MLQTNHYCTDSSSKWITTVQTHAPNESLLRRFTLQTYHYCADLCSKLITTAQTHAPNISLLRRLMLQTNHYCTDTHSKRITTEQIHAPNESLLTLALKYIIGTRWQRPYWAVLAIVFYTLRFDPEIQYSFRRCVISAPDRITVKTRKAGKFYQCVGKELMYWVNIYIFWISENVK